jgi:hypothetical protein
MKRQRIWRSGIERRWSGSDFSESPEVVGGQFVIIAPMSAAEEELGAIRAYDEAKASNDEAIPLAQAISEIEDESNDND